MGKRIVIDARESGTSTGRYVDKLIEYLHRLKPAHEFIILTKPGRLDYMRQIAPSFKIVESNFKEFTFAEQLGLKKQIKGLRPDLVHFTMPQQPAFYKGRVVTTIHDLTTIRFGNPVKNDGIFKIKQLVYGWLLKRVARKSGRLIAISHFTRDDIVKFAGIDPAKAEVVYEAADKITSEPKAISDLKNKQFLLYVGRPNPHKNLQKLIEAMAAIREKHLEIILVLAGKTDENYKRLAKFADDKNLSSQVFFTGFIPDDQLRWLYENALLYTFPSLSEGFGLPGLEAMSYGLPVVSSNATCLPEIYKDAALYFDPTDIDDMAAKLIQAIDDPSLRRTLAAKGSQLVKTYSWSKMAAQTLEVYEEALKS